jgi:MYXO-CTERM domain-containing protein
MLVVASAMVLSGAAMADAVTTWSYGGALLQYVVNTEDGPAWQNFEGGPSVGSTPLENGIKLFGTGDNFNVFHFNGASYATGVSDNPDYRGVQLVITGTGTIDGSVWSHPNDIIRTTFGIGFGISGGTLDVYKVETSFTLRDNENNFLIGVGSGTSLGLYEAGGYGVGFAFEDRFGSNYATATHFDWSVTIGFDWQGMGLEDEFNFSVEPNSIDLQAQTVPAPFSLALFGLGGLAARRRRVAAN